MRKLYPLASVVLVFLSLTFSSPGDAQAAGPTYHIVRPGQSMSSIASAYGISMWTLASANGLWNPNSMYVGQVLVIPYCYASAPWCGNVNPGPYYQPPYYPRPTYGCYYWVRYGDTLYSIARRYGTDAWSIARANGIYNLNWIYAGQRLLIPGCK